MRLSSLIFTLRYLHIFSMNDVVLFQCLPERENTTGTFSRTSLVNSTDLSPKFMVFFSYIFSQAEYSKILKDKYSLGRIAVIFKVCIFYYGFPLLEENKSSLEDTTWVFDPMLRNEKASNTRVV